MPLNIKNYNQFINEDFIDEGKAASILASLGKHAVSAIVSYLSKNPEVILDVFDNLKGSDSNKIKSQISKINQ